MSNRIDVAKRKFSVEYPNLLSMQVDEFAKLMQVGVTPQQKKNHDLYKIFRQFFPVSDSKNIYTLEFLDYVLDPPVYTPKECKDKKMTYGSDLKVVFRLTSKETNEQSVEEVYFGLVPYMTPQGSFIIKGIERVIVSQLHRSCGVFFDKNAQTGYNQKGIVVYSAKIIPFRGVWIEFLTDAQRVFHAYIDRRKKMPITLVIRPLLEKGTDAEILRLFDIAEEVAVDQNLFKHENRTLAAPLLKKWSEEFVDEETGELVSIQRSEVVFERDVVLDQETIKQIIDSDADSLMLLKDEEMSLAKIGIYNTLQKDSATSSLEALQQIYYQLRNVEAPDENAARDFFNQTFFTSQRSYLGEIGRYNINRKLGIDVSSSQHVLTKQDLLATIKKFVEFTNGRMLPDDIDSLSNRRLSTACEQLKRTYSIAVSRVARKIVDSMALRNADEKVTVLSLVSPRPMATALNSLFARSPFSQLVDQVNPLGEINIKRKISSIGPGAINKQHASIEARNIHHTQLGRVCPFATPEGPNMGLIQSVAIHAALCKMGFITTPYRKVENGIVDLEGDIEYLDAESEKGLCIAGALTSIDDAGRILDKRVDVHKDGEMLSVDPSQVRYIEISPDQGVSVSAALSPGLRHNESARVVMASNMQRQAVPLIVPEAPIVGTGIEKIVAKDFNRIPASEGEGEIVSVDANRIVVKYSQNKTNGRLAGETKSYQVNRLERTNQFTVIHLTPNVKKGDKVTKGDLLCNGFSVDDGELALGVNALVAYISYEGYTFEDAIVVSEELADKMTSIHLQEFVEDLSETKNGPEEFTADIPNASNEDIKNLDENGIVQVGTRIREGDIIIGKIVPNKTEDSSLEKTLLTAIFGQKAASVKDISLKAPPYFEGTVVSTQLLKRGVFTSEERVENNKKVDQLRKIANEELKNIKATLLSTLVSMLKNQKSQGVSLFTGEEIFPQGKEFAESMIKKHLFQSVSTHVGLAEASPVNRFDTYRWTANNAVNESMEKLLLDYMDNYYQITNQYKKESHQLILGDSLPTGVSQRARVITAKKRRVKAGDKLAGRHGNKGIVGKVVRKENMPYTADGIPVDICLSPAGIPSRMNVGQLLEAILGWAGKKLGRKYANPVFNGKSLDGIQEELKEAGIPSFGEVTLYNGHTGEPFDKKVTCGYSYILKLNHNVDEKMHARSTGPYNMTTQQPLGGKSQKGGQRLGEMEVWALQAHGAAANIRECFTIKSDDVRGRANAATAIATGKNIPEPHTSQSVELLIHELKALGLTVEFGETKSKN